MGIEYTFHNKKIIMQNNLQAIEILFFYKVS